MGTGMFSTILSISSVIIAVCSMIATLWQVITTRNHNKLSVRPHLDILQERILPERLSFAIINNGLGPAIINSISFIADGHEFKIRELLDIACQSSNQNSLKFQSCHVQEGTVIQSSGKLIVYQIQPNNIDTLLYAKFFKIIDNTEVVIEYESFYGTKFNSSDSLRFV